MMQGTRHDVRWNPDKLPRDWHTDEVVRDDVYRRIRRLKSEGYGASEIARQVGCSDRTVHRILRP